MENYQQVMELAFDPAEHKEFVEYVIANEKHFDKIQAEYIANKASGNQSGIIIAALNYLFVYHNLYFQLYLMVRNHRVMMSIPWVLVIMEV